MIQTTLWLTLLPSVAVPQVTTEPIHPIPPVVAGKTILVRPRKGKLDVVSQGSSGAILAVLDSRSGRLVLRKNLD